MRRAGIPVSKALTQFPSVLGNLAQNLSWTSALGEAYHTQAGDVMSADQVLRAKALAAGNLNRSLSRHASKLQCLWELWKLGGFKER